MNRPKRYNPPPELLENENVQKAIKILGAALMLTKSKGMESNFVLQDEFGVTHRYHLDISEKSNLILPDEP